MSKIVLVGAGGVIFAQNFMKDILLDEELRHHQLTLMDIDAGRLAHAATIGGLIAKKLNVEFHPETTTDLRQAAARITSSPSSAAAPSIIRSWNTASR